MVPVTEGPVTGCLLYLLLCLWIRQLMLHSVLGQLAVVEERIFEGSALCRHKFEKSGPQTEDSGHPNLPEI